MDVVIFLFPCPEGGRPLIGDRLPGSSEMISLCRKRRNAFTVFAIRAHDCAPCPGGQKQGIRSCESYGCKTIVQIPPPLFFPGEGHGKPSAPASSWPYIRPHEALCQNAFTGFPWMEKNRLRRACRRRISRPVTTSCRPSDRQARLFFRIAFLAGLTILRAVCLKDANRPTLPK